jgi:hypothetical protein
LINDEAAGSGFTVTTEDQFADTYTVDYNFFTFGSGATTVTRQNLCCWESPQLTGNGQEFSFVVRYRPALIDFNFGGGWFFTFGTCILTSGGDGAKTGNQNSPVGSYNGALSFVVS